MNIILIGYRGTGKSTVAPLVARQLGWNWIDADSYLEQDAGKTIRQIFETEGEGGFRDREVRVLSTLLRRNRHVIAAGGGAVLRAENRAAIRQAGITVWLQASPEVILGRISADKQTADRRPPLLNTGGIDEIRHLLTGRAPLYQECADLIINTEERSQDEVAAMIIQAAQSRWPPQTREP